jgi:quercetin dioxygenase-like cupin family protein
MLNEKTLELYALAKEEGQAIWFLDTLTFVKATGQQSGGAFGLIEHVALPGSGSPYHVHHAEEESFYVLEGELTFISGDDKFTGTAGSYVFLPRDIPHGFKVTGDKLARYLVMVTPAGFEQYIIELSQPATALVLPPARPPDMAKLMSLAAKYNIEILGPLPE